MKISLQQKKRREVLEGIIREGEKAFAAVGNAIIEIRDTELWKDTHETFEAYCQDTFGWSGSRARQLASAATVQNSLPPALKVPTEAAARKLASVPPPARASVVQKVVDAGKKITAAALSKAMPAKPAQPSTTGPKDATGLKLPSAVFDIWDRMPEAQELITKVASVIGALKKAQADNDELFAELNLNGTISHLLQAKIDLECAKPYAVCPDCNGVDKDGCSTCRGRGVLSKFYWENNIPKETKEITGRS